MPSKVYFANIRAASASENKITKLRRLFDEAGFASAIAKGDLTAIKLHFGEYGNDGYISPVFVRQIADKVKECGGKPYLVDTNTVYTGSRKNSVDHLVTAIEHGFGYAVTGAPIIIADGLHGENYKEVEIGCRHFDKVKLAPDVVDADSCVVLSHFKGHVMAGYGGAIKNMAMGGAGIVGKKEQHCIAVMVIEDKCIGCGKCLKICPQNAIAIANKKARVDTAQCIGCGECLTHCKTGAMDLDWGVGTEHFIERLTEYGYGMHKAHAGHICYVNFLTNITPDCDCSSWSDAPLVPDIGFLASFDPVALDQASLDMVNAQAGFANSALHCNHHEGENKFQGVYSYADTDTQTRYGEQIGMGSRDYELIPIDKGAGFVQYAKFAKTMEAQTDAEK